MRTIFKNKESGFSLVELMIVVGIIGILSTMAFPKFQEFQSKAKMAEAKTNLAHLFTVQQSYFLENDEFQAFGSYGSGNCNVTDATTLGFELKPCNAKIPRYTYTASAAGSQFVGNAQAKSTVCQNEVQHYFSINQDKDFAGPKSCADGSSYRGAKSLNSTF